VYQEFAAGAQLRRSPPRLDLKAVSVKVHYASANFDLKRSRVIASALLQPLSLNLLAVFDLA
jgi:hypothetical protein